MSKGWRIAVISVALFLVMLFLVVMVYYFWPWNKKFFDNANKEFAIPGLNENFVPQGFTQLEEKNQYLISGYMSDSTPSRFYVIDSESGDIVKYFTLQVGEKMYDGHAGGVQSAGSTIWTVGDGYCIRFMLSDIYKVVNGEAIKAKDYFETHNGADFVFANNGMLWIGEFYTKKHYETDMSHRLQTRTGEENPSIVFGYPINEQNKYGLNSTTPTKALSIVGKCQGIAMTSKGNFLVSSAFGVNDSNIYYYDAVLSEPEHSKYYYSYNEPIPMWYLDNQSLISTTKAPAMSEELIVKNDRVYILFESASKKYRMYNRKRMSNVYSLPMSFIDKN